MWFGSALGAAARGGNREVVELLLDKGADVNMKGGIYGSPLVAARAGLAVAIWRGTGTPTEHWEEIIALLLKRGAKEPEEEKSEDEDDVYDTSLLWASEDA